MYKNSNKSVIKINIYIYIIYIYNIYINEIVIIDKKF